MISFSYNVLSFHYKFFYENNNDNNKKSGYLLNFLLKQTNKKKIKIGLKLKWKIWALFIFYVDVKNVFYTFIILTIFSNSKYRTITFDNATGENKITHYLEWL